MIYYRIDTHQASSSPAGSRVDYQLPIFGVGSSVWGGSFFFSPHIFIRSWDHSAFSNRWFLVHVRWTRKWLVLFVSMQVEANKRKNDMKIEWKKKSSLFCCCICFILEKNLATVGGIFWECRRVVCAPTRSQRAGSRRPFPFDRLSSPRSRDLYTRQAYVMKAWLFCFISLSLFLSLSVYLFSPYFIFSLFSFKSCSPFKRFVLWKQTSRTADLISRNFLDLGPLGSWETRNGGKKTRDHRAKKTREDFIHLIFTPRRRGDEKKTVTMFARRRPTIGFGADARHLYL